MKNESHSKKQTEKQQETLEYKNMRKLKDRKAIDIKIMNKYREGKKGNATNKLMMS